MDEIWFWYSVQQEMYQVIKQLKPLYVTMDRPAMLSYWLFIKKKSWQKTKNHQLMSFIQ